jgi:hypothetical protein
MKRKFYSQRTGTNQNISGFSLDVVKETFLRVYAAMRRDGYFDEYLGSYCVNQGDVTGIVNDPDLDILLKVRKKDLWPIDQKYQFYNEDDLFDIIEYLFTVVSEPVDGHLNAFTGDMHWEKFDKERGERHYRNVVNDVLDLFVDDYEISEEGDVLQKPDKGFEAIFEAETPTERVEVRERVEAAIRKFRHHGASIEDRREAVRNLADVLEYLKPKIKIALQTSDEKDLFNIANNFGIRHHNDKQKNRYDASIWLSWMFYFYLATIHVILRKTAQE